MEKSSILLQGPIPPLLFQGGRFHSPTPPPPPPQSLCPPCTLFSPLLLMRLALFGGFRNKFLWYLIFYLILHATYLVTLTTSFSIKYCHFYLHPKFSLRYFINFTQTHIFWISTYFNSIFSNINYNSVLISGMYIVILLLGLKIFISLFLSGLRNMKWVSCQYCRIIFPSLTGSCSEIALTRPGLIAS